MAQILEIPRPTFLTNAVVLVDCLLDKTVRAVINPIILDSKDLLGIFNDVAILFIRRKGISDAHKVVGLSKSLGSHVWTHIDHLFSLASTCNNDSNSH